MHRPITQIKQIKFQMIIHFATVFLVFCGAICESFKVKLYSRSTIIARRMLADDDLRKAMENARNSALKSFSPGGDLLSADEQADAAYADLINTSIDQQGISSLSESEISSLNRGGKMWEAGSKSQSRKWGLLGDLKNLANALSGGAHIDNEESSRKQ